MGVAIEDGDLVRFRDKWMDRPPQRCMRGHWLLPGHMKVGSVSCSCGGHITWECECGDVTYGPALTESCTFSLNGIVVAPRPHRAWREKSNTAGEGRR
jgi:hypothetical protein